jgi:hypothetical protein
MTDCFALLAMTRFILICAFKAASMNDYLPSLPHDDPQADGLGWLSSPAPQADGFG